MIDLIVNRKTSHIQEAGESSPPSSRETTRPSANYEARQSGDHGVQSNDDGSSSAASDEDGEANVDGVAPQTAAEIRAEKRKMKRFRLACQQPCFILVTQSIQVDP